jgi:protein involved in polysaccharide export with SLBB domain
MVDMERVLQAKIVPGPYRAVAGDVLHVEMPRFPEQQPATTEADTRQGYNYRIEDDGTIILPLVGPLAVQGKSLAQIETAIAAQYYPKYVAAPLPVYVSVLEYRTLQVSVVGAVTQPGIHTLRHDRMSLVAALMQAGGITAPGAAVIRINRGEGQGGGLETEPVRDRPADPRPREQNIIPAQVDTGPGLPNADVRVGDRRRSGW